MSLINKDTIYRLLVIDDNRAIHEDFRKILLPNPALAALEGMEAELFDENIVVKERRSFDVDSAFQGQEGLEMVRVALSTGNPYSLAFVDMRMPPGWDGIETIERIWQEDPELQIVICSAYSDHSWAGIAQRLGSSDRLLILKKPFDNVEITQMAHAMSRKCELNRLEKELLRTAPVAEDDNTSKPERIHSADAALLAPLRDDVALLQRAFDQMALALQQLRETLTRASDLDREHLLDELRATVINRDLVDSQEQLPAALNRIRNGLE